MQKLTIAPCLGDKNVLVGYCFQADFINQIGTQELCIVCSLKGSPYVYTCTDRHMYIYSIDTLKH